MKDFKNDMEGIYTTSINPATLDESPRAYKNADEIIDFLDPTIKIISIMHPVYNFKSSNTIKIEVILKVPNKNYKNDELFLSSLLEDKLVEYTIRIKKINNENNFLIVDLDFIEEKPRFKKKFDIDKWKFKLSENFRPLKIEILDILLVFHE